MAKVLLIGPLPPPVGGDTVSFNRLVHSKYWEKNDYEKTIINTSQKTEIKLTNRILGLKDFIKVINIMFSMLKKINNVDLVILWGNSRFIYTAGLLIILIAKLFKKPITIKMFGGTFNDKFEKLPRIYKNIAIRIIKFVDIITPETKFLCYYFINKLKFPKNKIHHLPNFIASVKKEPFTINKINKSNIKCVFIAQLKAEKGLFDVIDMLKSAGNVNCDFYGPILSRDQNKFLREIANIDNAKYKGIARHDEVCKIISQYDILLLPTFHPGEGYPAVILEAFSTGTPVLATKWKAIPEIVQDLNNGFLVKPNSSNQILDKLLSILDKELYEKLCFNAQKTFQNNYTEEKILGENYFKVIKTLIEN
ncbi:MAG: glycosyltransferase family 4 protein [Candidatus Krumholzibacteriota bacterium]|nr:glycosyltransferase family 4 protein [Candidatus Krumholzibacteriota bacterium]